MGLLDPKESVVDLVLTGHGKMLLSQGQLRFVYWAAFDDEVIYDMSGSIVEDPLQREAVSGYQLFGNLIGRDMCNVNRALMTVPPGQGVIPSAMVSGTRTAISMSQQAVIQEYSQTDQDGNPVDPYSNSTQMGVLRFGSNDIDISMQYGKQDYPASHHLEGFYVTILASGTDGYVEQHHTLSDDSDIIVGPEVKVSVITYEK